MSAGKQWFLRKTTHGFSSTAHSGFVFQEDKIILFYCTPLTKIRFDRAKEVKRDHPSICAQCLKKMAKLVARQLRGDTRSTEEKRWD